MTDIEYDWSPSPKLYRITRTALAPVLKAYFRAEWYGSEQVPATGRVVLACNHLSNLDPVLLAVACPRRINYMAKAELFRVPLLGSLIRRYGAIPIRRSTSDSEAIRLAEHILENDEVLALFPEGTRSRDGQLKPFRFGAARLAFKYAAPLVPVAIVGTNKAMPAGGKLPRRSVVRIAFGRPVATESFQCSMHAPAPEPSTLEAATALLKAEVQRLKDELMQSVV